MKLAYLLNAYPMTSTTFIRREIRAIEALGQPVARHAIRHWDGALVDPADEAEREATRYLLTGNARGLAAAALRTLLRRPGAFLRAAALTLRMWRSSRREGFVRHVAWLLEAACFQERAREEGIDHVHAHFMTNAAAVALLSRVMGGPGFSFTVHGPDEFFAAQDLSVPAKVEAARFVVAISRFSRALLIGFAGYRGAEKIRLVRCGAPLETLDPTDPPSPENQTFVCVGRLCPAKAQVLIPLAVARLRGRFPRLRVRLVGDGESRGEVEAAIRACGVEDHVELLGWRDGEQVRELIRGSRALLLPSLAEGLPIVIMEALALGRPAISTEVAGIPELLDDGCGWVVPPGSSEALAEAMRAALEADAPTLARLGAEGRRRVARRHDQKGAAAELLALFRRAAAGEAAAKRAASAGQADSAASRSAAASSQL